MDIIIIIALILLNGVFSMSEMALISARKSRLASDAKNGSKTAQQALKLANEPDKFLSTVQIGITLIGILTGIYSGDVLAYDFAVILQSWGVPANISLGTSKIIIVSLVTYFTLIFGELIPKRIGLAISEKIARWVVYPMQFLSVIASPFVWILSKSSSGILKLMGIAKIHNKVTEEEIRSIIEEGTADGVVDEVEQDIVERVFSLGDRQVNSIMTPRAEIAWLDIHDTPSQIKEIVQNNLFEIYPVANDDLDDILGIVSLKDLFGRLDEEDFSLEKYLSPAQFFPETIGVYQMLEQLRITHGTYGLITDEFGVIQGMVTLKDVLEAIVGAMPHDEDEIDIVQRKDGTYLVDGQCPFYDFLTYFEAEDLFHNQYNTISGLLFDKLQHIPHTGETLKWRIFDFEIVDMDGARIDKVLVTKLP